MNSTNEPNLIDTSHTAKKNDAMSGNIEQAVRAYNENEEHDIPFSGVIKVSGTEDQSTEAAYGYANRSDQVANRTTTRFGIASGCKIFTAVAICQLVEQGKLAFDTKLSDCTKVSFPNFDPDINVHHLLTHSSGVPDYFDEEVMDDFEELWRERPTYGMTKVSHFLPLFAEEPMKFAPGERFAYNNSGYILLGLIVENVSGLNFRDYVETHIFNSCGMTDSGYFRMDRLPERTALGYIDSEDGWKTNIFSLPVVGGPDGGAFTTIGDLDKFWSALFGYQLLSEKLTQKLLSPQITEDEDTAYGYGIWIGMDGEHVRCRYIMGFDPGVSMVSRVYADFGLRVHVLANIDGAAWQVAADVGTSIRESK